MHITGKGERQKTTKKHRLDSTSHGLMQKNAHLATGITIPYISVYQSFFHQDNTNHLQLSNMFTQSLSHMFPMACVSKNRATSHQSPAEIL